MRVSRRARFHQCLQGHSRWRRSNITRALCGSSSTTAVVARVLLHCDRHRFRSQQSTASLASPPAGAPRTSLRSRHAIHAWSSQCYRWHHAVGTRLTCQDTSPFANLEPVIQMCVSVGLCVGAVHPAGCMAWPRPLPWPRADTRHLHAQRGSVLLPDSVNSLDEA